MWVSGFVWRRGSGSYAVCSKSDYKVFCIYSRPASAEKLGACFPLGLTFLHAQIKRAFRQHFCCRHMRKSLMARPVHPLCWFPPVQATSGQTISFVSDFPHLKVWRKKKQRCTEIAFDGGPNHERRLIFLKERISNSGCNSVQIYLQ